MARSIHTRNKIEQDGSIAYIYLYNIDNIPVARTVVDSKNIDMLKDIKWHLHSKNYVRSQSTGIHNLITGHKPVDHINGNPLDNRESNLRKCSTAENNRNTSGHLKKSSTEFKGVFLDYMTRKPFKASIAGITIGRYFDSDEAAWMYDQYAISIFGDFAKTNFDYI